MVFQGPSEGSSSSAHLRRRGILDLVAMSGFGFVAAMFVFLLTDAASSLFHYCCDIG